MNLVDTSGWLEYFADTASAKHFARVIESTSSLIVPTIVIYEVFKKVRGEFGEDKAFVATEYEGQPLAEDHGGPARLVVPGLYFWKSAKWLRGLHFSPFDYKGYWEKLGYHNYGDPWLEQRYDEEA